jgi:hypothetical protein
LGRQSDTLTGPGRSAGFNPVNSVAAQQFISVSQQISEVLAAATEIDFSFLLRDVKAKTGVVHRVSDEFHDIGSR